MAVENIVIAGNGALTSLEGLSHLAAARNRQSLDRNQRIIDLSGLDNLAKVGELSITGNAALASFDGLNDLTSVDHLNIVGNDTLTSLEGLSNLKKVLDLTIKDNATLCQSEAEAFAASIAEPGSITVEGNLGACP